MFGPRRVTPLCVRSLLSILFVMFGLGAASSAGAATLPSGFTETRVATGLASPTAMSFAPDGRLFVAEQGGRLRIIKNGALLSTPFVTLNVNATGERGLLGVAFDPNFGSNQFVYVYYTTASAPHNRVSRFTASAANPDVAVSGSEVILLDLPELSNATNHNGGAIHFGLDGMLYIAVGENAHPPHAPSLSTTFGKILRIRPDGTIPSDNPFFNQTSGINRAIWARGLRNPFNFAVDRASGRIHVNDVGQDTWEEVNRGIAGADYGWPGTEGPNPPGVGGITYPTHAYANAGANCAIVGAAFYSPPTINFPAEYSGRYFFGDFCGGFIRMLSPPDYTTSAGFATGISSLVDIQVAPDGTLYYLARGNGEVFRVQYASTGTPPDVTDHPDDVTIAVGQSATFQVAATGTGPLQYQWQRNNSNISGATNSSYTVSNATLADSGATFRAVVSNTFGSDTSASATLTVTGNGAPTGTITAPANGTLYRGGQTFNFSGTVSDPEDGTLPASRFTWRVDLHHDTHSHPHMPPTSGITGGTFTIPNRGETSANVFYRLHLTVTDSSGLTHSSFVDVRPRTSQVTIASSPSGLQLTLDGQPIAAPHTFTGVEGVIRSIGVVTPQTFNGTTYTFVNWSDSGAATHEITTPDPDSTYTASFSGTVTPPSGNIVYSDDFEIDRGWMQTPGANGADQGRWERGDPQPTTANGIATQLDSCDNGSVNCFITGLAAGSTAFANDVDGGETDIISPPIVLPTSGRITLSFRFYFAHLNTNTNWDHFRVRVVRGDGTNQTVFQEFASADNDAAAWTTQTVDLSALAGQTIRLRFEAAEFSTRSNLVEAGLDNVTITRE